ncbi:unnamed protein product [Discosporangium mesarthrocarpum]
MSRSWSAVVSLLVIAAAPIADTATIKVSPSGSPSLSDAIKSAKPGDTIHLANGRYKTGIMSFTDGEEDAPITITGSRDAVVSGINTDQRVVTIKHDHIHLRGFTVDGQMGNGDTLNSYANKCVFVHGQTTPKDITYMGHTFPSSINGLVISNMSIKNCQGECIRLKYFVTHSDIQDNDVQNCGVDDFVFNAGSGGKNGEGLYMGTSSTQWGDGKNPDSSPDQSNFNLVKNNIFLTHGNECVESKEGTEHNVVEGNTCGGQLDEKSACFGSRGNRNIFRNNKGEGCYGAGIRLGGHMSYGINNKIYKNTFTDVQSGSIKIMKTPQDEICGNGCSGGNCGVMGTFGTRFTEWDQSCPGNIDSDMQPYGNKNSGGNFTPHEDDDSESGDDRNGGGDDDNNNGGSDDDNAGDDRTGGGDDDNNNGGNDDNNAGDDDRTGGLDNDNNGGNDDNNAGDDDRTSGGNDDNSGENDNNNSSDDTKDDGDSNGGNDDNNTGDDYKGDDDRTGGSNDDDTSPPPADGDNSAPYPGLCTTVKVEHDSLSQSSSTSILHPALNLFDNDLTTRWSAKGRSGSYMTIDLGEKVSLAGISLAVYEGFGRKQSFEVTCDYEGKVLIPKMETSGTSDTLEFYPFNSVLETQTITLHGFGNTVNVWNSFTSLELCGAGDGSRDNGSKSSRRLRGST